MLTTELYGYFLLQTQFTSARPTKNIDYKNAFQEVENKVNNKLPEKEEDIIGDPQLPSFLELAYRIKLIKNSNNSDKAKYHLLCGYLLTVKRHSDFSDMLADLSPNEEVDLIESYHQFMESFTLYDKEEYEQADANLRKLIANNQDNVMAEEAERVRLSLNNYLRNIPQHATHLFMDYKEATIILKQTRATLANVGDKTKTAFEDYGNLINKFSLHASSQKKQGVIKTMWGFFMTAASVLFTMTLPSLGILSGNVVVAALVGIIGIILGVQGIAKGKSILESGVTLFNKAQAFKAEVLPAMRQLANHAQRPGQAG